jgi:hypothetical protein
MSLFGPFSKFNTPITLCFGGWESMGKKNEDAKLCYLEHYLKNNFTFNAYIMFMHLPPNPLPY